MTVTPLRQKRDLTLEEKKLSLVENLSIGVMLLSLDGRIEFVNASASDLLGVRIRNPEQRLYSEFVWVAAIQRMIEGALGALSANISEDIELDVRGQRRWLLVTCGPFSDYPNVIVTFEDITARKRIEETRRDFVANVSHELKTPVTVIQGFVETLLATDASRDEEDSRFLSSIARHTERLHRLCEDLLSLARLENSDATGGVPLKDGDVAALVKEVCGDFVSSSQASGVTLTVSMASPTRALLHEGLFVQAIENLLKNAVSFTPAGGEIRVSVLAEGRSIRVVISDTGCGIAPEHLSRIFERFYRVDQSRARKDGGSGLGLAIVKHIAILHGGSVEVQSEVGKGSQFSFLLQSSEKGNVK